MEINEYRPKQARLNKAASEYEAAQIKAQHIKPSGQEQKPTQINKNEHTILRGEIIDLRYQEVKVRLEPSGQVITARLSGELPLSIGQTAEFVVSDVTDGLITLRYLHTGNSPINDIIHKALYASGLTASERNLTIVQELLNYQMPVNKNTILQLIKLTSAYPDVAPATLVLMHKNGLPINVASIAQFEAYQKSMHQILTQLKSLISHINTITSNNQPLVGDDISPDIIQAGNRTFHDETFISTSINDTIDSLNLQGSDQLNNIPSNNTLSNGKQLNNPQMNPVYSSNIISLHKELLALLIDQENRQEQISPATEVGRILSNDEIIGLKDMLLERINDSSFYSSEAKVSIQNQLPNGSMTLESLLTLVYDIYGKDSSQLLSDKSMLPLSIAEAFIGISSKLSGADREKLVHLLKSDSYRDAITEALHQRWTLSPKELTKENKVREFFTRLDKDMEGLDRLTDSLKLSSEIKSSINKLQDSLQFMRDLNELFLYLQLPIRLMEQDVHGDLYVFTRKKKHNHKENLNVLLHLDMTNLGSLDIHMSMRSSTINAVFYVEKSSQQIIAEHLHELTHTLSKKGYQLQAKTQLSESKPDFIAGILQEEAPSSSTHRYTFDIRA